MFVLDPDTMGQTLCGGVIGLLGTLCIKPAPKFTISSHKNKVNISVPTIFVTQGNKVFMTPIFCVLDISMMDVKNSVSREYL